MFSVIYSAAAVGVGALRENPLRTILSTLGVIIGVASLTAVLSLGDALQAFAKSEIDRVTDAQSITIESRRWYIDNDEWKRVKNITALTERDFNTMVAALPEARAAWMTRSGAARIAYRRTGLERDAAISAVSAGIVAVDRPKIGLGRSFSPREATNNAAVVVISDRLAAELADGRPVATMLGEQVRVGRIPREVIGIFEAQPGERGYMARIPLAGAAATFPPSAMESAPTVTLRAAKLGDVESLESGVQDWLAQHYTTWENRFELVMAEEMLREINLVFTVLKVFLGMMAGISMVVGGIGIMNIMLASVTERTREIGIRKAIGASRRDIQFQFLTEAVTVSMIGSAIGTIGGFTLSTLAVATLRFFVEEADVHVVLTPVTLLLAAGIAITVGLVFGTYPARRASRLSPIEAIRHE